MTEAQPIEAEAPCEWPVLDSDTRDTPIFYEVAVDLGLIKPATSEEPTESEQDTDEDTGETAGGDQD